ncbi:ribosome maturation factor RimM [Acidobacteria bacterium AH-259-D05]|nr:ribosome maturation factor RimM [Acidobacteria bacterium AH-259-D05]
MVPFAIIARIVKTRGVRGEVAAELLTDFPDRFSSLCQVRILNEDKEYWEEIEEHWFHKGRIILKFQGRDRPEEVEELIGGEIQISEDHRVSLPEDSYYHCDLIGCRVLEGGETLGTVTGILETGFAGCNLVVTTFESKEFQVPWVREFILSVDVKNQVIEVNLPLGLAAD